jgi:hypothetical protein
LGTVCPPGFAVVLLLSAFQVPRITGVSL